MSVGGLSRQSLICVFVEIDPPSSTIVVIGSLSFPILPLHIPSYAIGIEKENNREFGEGGRTHRGRFLCRRTCGRFSSSSAQRPPQHSVVDDPIVSSCFLNYIAFSMTGVDFRAGRNRDWVLVWFLSTVARPNDCRTWMDDSDQHRK